MKTDRVSGINTLVLTDRMEKFEKWKNKSENQKWRHAIHTRISHHQGSRELEKITIVSGKIEKELQLID